MTTTMYLCIVAVTFLICMFIFVVIDGELTSHQLVVVICLSFLFPAVHFVLLCRILNWFNDNDVVIWSRKK